jgi:hypothetical protein
MSFRVDAREIHNVWRDRMLSPEPSPNNRLITTKFSPQRARFAGAVIRSEPRSVDPMFAELQAATARGMPEIRVLVAIAAKYGLGIEPPAD